MMKTPILRTRPALLAILIGGLSLTFALAASPQLNTIMPRGIQRGHEHTVTFRGARLQDAQEVLFYGQGITATKVEPAEKGDQVQVTVQVADDCQLGEHIVQLRCESGISEFRSVFVGALPQVVEAENRGQGSNGSLEEAQAIDLNVTVAGVIKNEDVDFYKVTAKKGERINAEIEAVRLGTVLFDPYIAILDSRRFELSAADDTPLVRQDAIASVMAPADGDYYVMVRESAYGGNNNYHYRLHVGNFPRPLAIFPAGGKRGQETAVTYLSDPAGPIEAKLDIPADAGDEFDAFARDGRGIAPSPVPFRPFDYDNALEVEPNNERQASTVVQLPQAINGIIDQPDDQDWFRFTAKKGQAWEVECYARRIRSGLDPIVNIFQAGGKHIVGNDDSRGADSYVRFTAPANGEYELRIRDHLERGQADFVYRIEFTPVSPSLKLGIPRVARYSQYRQSIFIPRGNRFATLITANRKNFGGEIALTDFELPPGVTVHALPMTANLNVMPVVFAASNDAEIRGHLTTLAAKHVENENIRGIYQNNADFVLGPPNNAVYISGRVNKIPIAVVKEIPFRLEIEQPKSPLVRGGSKQLKIVAHRDEGFDEQIRVEFPFRPPGLGTTSAVNIPKGKSEVNYPLNANGKARLQKWPIYAIGSANVGGKAWAASQLAELEIAEPYVSLEMQRTSCEQGQPAQLYCKVNQLHPFEGKAKAQIFGLPPKSTADVLEFDASTKELTFVAKTEAGTPAGNHKSVFCQVTVMVNGEPVVFRAGRTQLQVDKPLPKTAKKDRPQPKHQQAANPEKQPQKPPKPLSRLQKLRLAAQELRTERLKKLSDSP